MEKMIYTYPKGPKPKKHENENEKIILVGQILLKKKLNVIFFQNLRGQNQSSAMLFKKKKKKEMIVRPLNCLSSEPK